MRRLAMLLREAGHLEGPPTSFGGHAAEDVLPPVSSVNVRNDIMV
jgi:hypothetical protein